jgi:hypothetical protein
MSTVIPSEVEGCNAADEVREARLSIPLRYPKGTSTGSLDSASLRSG